MRRAFTDATAVHVTTEWIQGEGGTGPEYRIAVRLLVVEGDGT